MPGVGHPALDPLADCPILLVCQVPKIDGVGRVEAGIVGGRRREEPRTFDACSGRAEWREPMGKDVVGMRRDHQVWEQGDVNHLAEETAGDARQRFKGSRSIHGHRRCVRLQVHGASTPQAGRSEVGTAADGCDFAQCWVNGSAVVTLVEVLDDDLPIRFNLVLLPLTDGQPIGLVGCEHAGEVADLLIQGRRDSVEVDEEPAAPGVDGNRYQRVVALVEAEQAGEARGGPQRAVEAIGPRVVRAADEPGIERITDGGQLVASVSTDV